MATAQAAPPPGEQPETRAVQAAFALTRTQIDSLWEPIAWPMRRIEVIGLAQRMSLSHEQTIAIERLHDAYVADARDQRLAAIDAWFRLNPEAMRVPHVIAPDEDVRKLIALRRGWMTTLTQLDATLFANFADVLNEEQKSRLPREAMRRERARFSTDAWVAQWWGNGGSPRGGPAPPEITVLELADVLVMLSLDNDAQAAAESALVDGETKQTRQLRALFDAACEAREQWNAIKEPHNTPPGYDRVMQITNELANEAAACVAVERALVDRAAAALTAEQAEAFRDLVARIIGGDLYETWTSFTAIAQAALSLDGLTPQQRAEVEAMLADFRKRARANRYEWLFERRQAGKFSYLRIGNQSLMPEVDDPFTKANAASNALRVASNEQREALRGVIGKELFGQANHLEIQKRSAEREQTAAAAFEPTSNLGWSGANDHPRSVLPRSPGGADIDAVLRQLNLDEGTTAIIRTLNEERAAAWAATVKKAEVVYHEQTSVSRNDEVKVPDVAKIFGAYRTAAAEILASEAEFITSLRIVLENVEDEAIDQIALGRAWASMTTMPPAIPAPINLTGSIARSMIIANLDRANPVRILLELDLPTGRIEPGLAVLRARIDATQTMAEQSRGTVLDALEANESMQVVMNPQYGGSWNRGADARKRQVETALAALAMRRSCQAELKSVHAAVIAALDADAGERYHRALQRVAYPSAVAGVDEAMRIFDRAIALAETAAEDDQRLAAAAERFRRETLAEADAIEALIDAFVAADDPTPEAEAKSAAIYAKIEHAIFVKDELCAAAESRCRAMLTFQQMQLIQRSEAS